MSLQDTLIWTYPLYWGSVLGSLISGSSYCEKLSFTLYVAFLTTNEEGEN